MDGSVPKIKWDKIFHINQQLAKHHLFRLVHPLSQILN